MAVFFAVVFAESVAIVRVRGRPRVVLRGGEGSGGGITAARAIFIDLSTRMGCVVFEVFGITGK